MLRALAAFPIDLPAAERATPFQPVAIEDIAATIAWLADALDGPGGVAWDLMQPQPITLGGVIEQFRWSFGTARWPRITLPAWLLDLGARLGDLASLLGWAPPMRSTAIAELRRGVTGDPGPWMAATGIAPITHRGADRQPHRQHPGQMVRAAVPGQGADIVSLALFWIVSGFIALVISYPAAKAILTSHHVPPSLAAPFTILSSLMDMTVGCLIAFRRTCAAGLIAGIVVVARLHGRLRAADAGPVDRTARRAGQDRPGHRADGGGAVDPGQPMMATAQHTVVAG